jgi:putative membrane protein
VLRTSHGLFGRRAAVFPAERMQVVTIRQPLVMRWVGYASIEAWTAARSQGQDELQSRSSGSVAPIIPLTGVPRVLREVLPGLELERLDWQPAPPDTWKRGLLTLMLVILVASASAAVWLSPSLALCAPLGCTWAWFAARGYARGYAWAVAGDHVAYRQGWLSRQTAIAHVPRAQALVLHESPRDRRWGTASVRVETAAPSGASDELDIAYVPRARAATLFEVLRARVAEQDAPAAWQR